MKPLRKALRYTCIGLAVLLPLVGFVVLTVASPVLAMLAAAVIGFLVAATA